MARKSRELRVISYFTYPDGRVVLWDDLSEEEKERIRAEQAKRTGEVMSEYYRTHPSKYFDSL